MHRRENELATTHRSTTGITMKHLILVGAVFLDTIYT